METLLNNFDIGILNFIRDNLTNPIMDKIMVFITSMGDSGFIWIVIAIILLAQKKYRKVGIILLSALLLNLVLGEVIIKNIVQRPRAFITYPDISIIINPPDSYSFPSGHTASSFTAALIIGHYLRNWKYEAYALASLIAFSRLYLYVHYPTDIICGILLGTISALITIRFSENSKIKKLIK